MSSTIGRDLRMPAKLLLASGALLAVAVPFAIGLGQATAEFDVASIKPAKGKDGMMRIQNTWEGRFVAEGINTKMLIANAYDVHDFRSRIFPRGSVPNVSISKQRVR